MWSKRKEASAAYDKTAGSLRFAITGMHCGSCGLSVDEAVEDVAGVTRSTTSFRSGITEVDLDQGAGSDQVTSEVVAAIRALGYAASPLGS